MSSSLVIFQFVCLAVLSVHLALDGSVAKSTDKNIQIASEGKFV